MIIFLLVFAISAVNAQDLNESGADSNMDEGIPISNVNQDDESYVEPSIDVLGDSDVPISDNLPTVESGAVSGGVDIAAAHPWAPSDPNGNWGNVSYVIPEDATDIKFAHVYVSIYSGNAQPTYGSIADINVTVNGNLILNTSETLWVSSGSTDGVHYILNDHITKCYSDYMIFYNITDSVQGLQGSTVSVDVLSKPLQNKQFDGRIKLVSVVLAYDDGDSDIINYWFNAGQAWTNRDIYSYFDTEDVEIAEGSNSTLINIALSSIDGQYILNTEHLYESEEDISGAYYQYHRWNVSDYMVSGEKTELKYIASEDGWGSFKAVMALLTIQTPHQEPVIPKTNTSIGIVGDITNKQITVTLTDVNGTAVANAGMYYTINGGNPVDVSSNVNGSFVIHNLIGDVDIFVSYAGNDTFAPSNNTASFSFPKRSTKIMVTSIDGVKLELTGVLLDDADNPISGAVVSYTLNGAGKSNARTDGNGEFTVQAENDCLINMTFDGDDTSKSSNAAFMLKNIKPVPKATQIIADQLITRTAVDYKAGEVGSYYYFYLKDIDGNPIANKVIQVGVVGKIYKVKTNADGRAGISISIAKAVSYTYALVFLGDDDYKASFSTSELKIVKKPVTITPAKTSYSFKASAKTKTVTATLKSNNAYIPKGKQVTLSIAGKTFKATIGANGKINFNIGALTAKGTYKVAIKYAGTDTYSAATSKTITIKIS